MAYGELTIEVKVEDLLKTLRTNREKHVKEYEKAKKGYLKLLRKELELKLDILDAVEAGTPKTKVKGHGGPHARLTHINHQPPQTYVSYYDQAIEMLEFAQNTTVDLDQNQFQQYVKDEWNWKAQFTTSNVAYAAAAR